MSYEVKGLLQDDGILRIAIRGERDPQGVVDLILRVVELARQPGAQCLLIDIRELRGRASLGESYFNIRNIPLDSPRLKTAVLELEEYIENGIFYDTAAGNMGYKVRHFVDEAAALVWLAQDAPTASEVPAIDASAITTR